MFVDKGCVDFGIDYQVGDVDILWVQFMCYGLGYQVQFVFGIGKGCIIGFVVYVGCGVCKED